MARNIFHLLSSSVVQKAIAFVYFALIARWAGVEDTGAYFVALSWALMFTTITDMGLTPLLIRESAKDAAHAERYLNQTLALKVPRIALAVVSAAGGAWLFHLSPETRLLIVFASAVIALDAISLTFYGVLRGYHVLKYEGFGLIVGQTLTMVIGLAALRMGLPLYVLVIALIAGSLWNALASWWIVRTRLGLRIRPSWDPAFARTLLKTALPFALAGIFVKIYTNADAVMLAHFKDEAAAGLYSVPYKLTFAFQFVPMAFTAAFYPAMSRAWHRQDPAALGDLLYKALWTLALIAAPLIAGVAALAPELIGFVYGPDYLPSIIAAQLLILVLIPVFLDFPIGSLLNATDRQAIQTVLMGAATLVSVLLNLLLIPPYGIFGSVVASLVSHLVLLVGGFWAVGRFLKWPSARYLAVFFRVILAAVGMGLAVHFAKPFMPWPAAVALGVFLYPALAFLFGAVRMTDVRDLKDRIAARV